MNDKDERPANNNGDDVDQAQTGAAGAGGAAPAVIPFVGDAGEEQPGADGEDWGTAERDGATELRPYDPKKDQDLHLLAMKFLGMIAVAGIAMGGALWAFKGNLPDFLGVVVGSAVTAIAALFSKKG